MLESESKEVSLKKNMTTVALIIVAIILPMHRSYIFHLDIFAVLAQTIILFISFRCGVKRSMFAAIFIGLVNTSMTGIGFAFNVINIVLSFAGVIKIGKGVGKIAISSLITLIVRNVFFVVFYLMIFKNWAYSSILFEVLGAILTLILICIVMLLILKKEKNYKILVEDKCQNGHEVAEAKPKERKNYTPKQFIKSLSSRFIINLLTYNIFARLFLYIFFSIALYIQWISFVISVGIFLKAWVNAIEWVFKNGRIYRQDIGRISKKIWIMLARLFGAILVLLILLAVFIYTHPIGPYPTIDAGRALNIVLRYALVISVYVIGYIVTGIVCKRKFEKIVANEDNIVQEEPGEDDAQDIEE